MTDMAWVNDLAADVLKSQFQDWKQSNVRNVIEHKCKVGRDGKWYPWPDPNAVSDGDGDLPPHGAVDLMACSEPRGQPIFFWMNSLEGICTALKSIVFELKTDFATAFVVHENWVQNNPQAPEGQKNPWNRLEPLDRQKDIHFSMEVRSWLLNNAGRVPEELMTDERLRIIQESCLFTMDDIVQGLLPQQIIEQEPRMERLRQGAPMTVDEFWDVQDE